MSQDHSQITCAVAIEHLTATGQVSKKSLHRKIACILGRNEFRDVMLRLELGKRNINYCLRQVKAHTKFVKDGKATIKLPDQNVQLLFSNCPPDKLLLFMKTMSVKHTCLVHQGLVSDRKKLLSELPRAFEDISPLNNKDAQTLHNIRAKQAEKKGDFMTPKTKNGVAIKRKREAAEDKENQFTQASKVARKSLPVTRPVTVQLTKEQTQVLNAVLSGSNIFFTGSAGTGKSFLLRKIIGALPPNHTFATASTGVAACHIGGTTLHAFAGIGSGTATIERCIELAQRPIVASQWRKCRHLIIDEISMVDGEFFTKLELVGRIIRKNDSPFGGIQLILCGDFLQLPPVVKGNEKRKFCFQSNAWRKCIHKNMVLTEVRRQADKNFIDILQNIRMGRCPESVTNTLTGTYRNRIETDGILATRLCTHKEDVDHINALHLGKLEGESRVFKAIDSDPFLVQQLNNMCPVPQKLELKQGAQVMLAKNLDVQRGLVNGARGVVIGFEPGALGLPVVKFVCGVEQAMHPERWTCRATGGVDLSRRQLPLKLAWAISIHKSQGMTLDCVEMSLSRVFECGQAYVALSRACSLKGLRVLDFDSNCVRAHSEVLKFYQSLKSARQETKAIMIENIW